MIYHPVPNRICLINICMSSLFLFEFGFKNSHLFWVADWAVSQTVWHFGQKFPFLWCVSKMEWVSSVQWVSRSWTWVDAGSWHLLMGDVCKACLLLVLTCLRMVLCGWRGYCGYCSYDCAVVILSYYLT